MSDTESGAQTGTVTHEAAANYLASLQAALSDLPPAEVEEIMDDVGQHVAEVTAELSGQDQDEGDDLPRRLRERLGEPEQYAAELRAAAGYPPRPAEQPAEAPRPRLAGLRVALWLLILATLLAALAGLGKLAEGTLLVAALATLSLIIVLRHPGKVAAFAELPELRWLRARNPDGKVEEYARLVQPGWWLIRALGITAVFVGASFFHPLVLLLAVPLVIGSVWLGRRSQTDRRWLWLVLPLNAMAIVATLGLSDQAPVEVGVPTPASSADESGPKPGLMLGDVDNIYPFDSTGQPLSGIYLYDEHGQPITLRNLASKCLPPDRIPVPANQYPQPVYAFDPATNTCVRRSNVPTPTQLPTESATTSPSSPPTSAPATTTAPSPSPTG